MFFQKLGEVGGQGVGRDGGQELLHLGLQRQNLLLLHARQLLDLGVVGVADQLQHHLVLELDVFHLIII